MYKNIRNKNNQLLLLGAGKFILPFLTQDRYYQPHRDEFLYLAEGHHLAWGFMEVPPLLPAFARLVHFFGDNMFWIKFWPDIFGLLTFLIIGKIAISLGGKFFSLIICLMPFLFGNYALLFFLFQPNFLEVFWWTLMAFSLVRYTQSSDNGWVYIFGISFGLGTNSKYSAIFFLLSLLAGLLITNQRRIFLNKHFYGAALISFLILLPNLVWQYHHSFPVFHHMEELQQQQLRFVQPLEFLKGQLLLELPCILIWTSGLGFLLFNKKGQEFKFFGIAYLVLIIIFTFLHGKDYYTLGSYTILYVFGAVYLESISVGRYQFIKVFVVAYTITVGLYFFPENMPIARPSTLSAYYKTVRIDGTGTFKWEDHLYHSLPQDYADMLGWRETAEKVAKVYKSLPVNERAKTLIFCPGYAFAGTMVYYQKPLGLPMVYSGESSFLLWLPLRYDIENIIWVSRHLPAANNFKFQQFASVTVMDSLSDPFARENGAKIILYRHARPIVNKLMAEFASKKQAEFIKR